MKSRIILASMLLAAIGIFSLSAAAQQGDKQSADKQSGDANKLRDELAIQEAMLKRQYAEFEDSVLKLAQRLKRSSKLEDRDRAAVLEKVLEESRNSSILVQFEQIVDHLKKAQLTGSGETQIALQQANKLADDLRRILDLYRQDPRSAKIRDEIATLKKFIERIDKIRREQQMVQGRTELGKDKADVLGNAQKSVTKATGELHKDMEKFSKGGEAKNMKGDAKEGGKAPNKGEAKGAEANKGETKGADKESQGQKAGAKGGDKAQGDPKPGEPKPGEQKPGAKADDPKGGEAKAGKGGDKSGEGKEGGKGGESKQADAKGGDQKGGQGQAKEGGQKGEQGAQKPGPQDQGNQNPKDDLAQSRKKVQDAEGYEKQAENNIEKGNKDDASNDQGEAITKLDQAKKKLEELLRQLREEELERLLAALQNRCEKMLRMQIAVYHGTEGLYKVIEATADKKPRREDQQQSIKLSDQEKDIVSEATKAIEMLEAEGSAVAFPEVFQQVREDMKHVQRRLEITDVGIVTQAIEKDIITSLEEMIAALKKAKQDLDNKKNPSDPKNNPNVDQKLLDQIAELKMIRSLQLRVNARTETYGKMYVPKEGEQTADPAIRRELQDLGIRQERIYDVTNRIAKGDNK
ncbi:MAG: hypothetical protein HY040_25595 [Planctomycetes bacterium]|nr:hypothetical protein [Planctomycetota bacterium]